MRQFLFLVQRKDFFFISEIKVLNNRQITMAKEEGSKTVVVGGKSDVAQS